MNDADYKRIKDLYDALKLRGFHVATSRRKAFLYVLDNSTSIVSIDRLIAWLRDLNRGPAVTSFTEGPARQVAYALEEAIRIERETVAMPRPLPMRPLEKCSRCGFVQVRMADDKGAIPSTAADPRKLAAELRERINPAYADTLGTESHERRLCAEAIEGLLAQRDELAIELKRLIFAAECRDNTTGDPCRLIEVKAELVAANEQARAALAMVKP